MTGLAVLLLLGYTNNSRAGGLFPLENCELSKRSNSAIVLPRFQHLLMLAWLLTLTPFGF